MHNDHPTNSKFFWDSRNVNHVIRWDFYLLCKFTRLSENYPSTSSVKVLYYKDFSTQLDSVWILEYRSGRLFYVQMECGSSWQKTKTYLASMNFLWMGYRIVSKSEFSGSLKAVQKRARTQNFEVWFTALSGLLESELSLSWWTRLEIVHNQETGVGTADKCYEFHKSLKYKLLSGKLITI